MTVAEDTEAGGYVLELPYTWGFFEYQSPTLLSYIAARAGFRPPAADSAFSYVDLGCGNGVTVNMLAASFPNARFWGIDINPEHIDNARQSAARAGLNNVTFLDCSFAEALGRPFPEFDFITLHGIYSWVGQNVREEIHDFIDRHAGPRCILYQCYNAMPGAAKLIPLWKVMRSHGRKSGRGIAQTVPEGLAVLEDLAELNAKFFQDHPTAKRRVDKIGQRDLAYLLHEFGNSAFEPQFFADTASTYGLLGFSYAGSARPDRNNPENLLSRRFSPVLEVIDDPTEREALSSFIRNEGFRWDVYARGTCTSDPGHITDCLGPMRFGALPSGQKVKPVQPLGRRRIDLRRAPYRALLRLLAGDGCRFDAVMQHTTTPDEALPAILAALDDLIALGHVVPLAEPLCPVDVTDNDTLSLTQPTNREFLSERLVPDGRVYLASACLGSALRLGLIDGLCATAIDGNAPEDHASALLALAKRYQSEPTVRRKLNTAEIGPEWAATTLRRFKTRRLPALLASGIFAAQR